MNECRNLIKFFLFVIALMSALIMFIIILYSCDYYNLNFNCQLTNVNATVIDYNCEFYSSMSVKVVYFQGISNHTCFLDNGIYHNSMNKCIEYNEKFYPLGSYHEIFVDKNNFEKCKIKNNYVDYNLNIIFLAFFFVFILTTVIFLSMCLGTFSQQLIQRNNRIVLNEDDIDIEISSGNTETNNYIKILKTNNAEDKECSICLEEFTNNDEYFKFECNHTFHEKCITKWSKKNKNCPNCRKVIIV